MGETADPTKFPGDCLYDPCDGCPIQALPESMRHRAMKGVEQADERNVHTSERAGKYAARPLVNVVRRAVGGAEFAQASVAAIEALGRKAMRHCQVVEAE